ncbi:retrovirus-related Pol polyprotein from transposon 17.6 [Trichonephila clavipes]|uniref:Retrovirus-related Pol polyprotein from transposon 17.6 n=1 Tax=Trichonephila clavipes TaxID=2585209 RepID=A0A8X6RWU4_TRICX|nr:retrovirus-related Pol polyprotein from transposon 17.6 [Trichonephila clavipes]
MADLKDLKGALVFAMKFEAAQQATRKDRHPIRAVNESDTSNSSVEWLERQMRSFMNRVESLMSQKADGKKTLKCWTCGREGHLQRSCRARQGAETNKRLPEGGVGKLINDHLVGRRLPDFGKPHIPVCQISTKSTGENGIFIMGHEHGFTLDFNKKELRSIHEEVTIFKIEHRTESIRQVTANENITIPPRTEIIVPGYIGNDKGEVLATCSPVTCVCKSSSLLLSNSPQQLTPDLLENAELSLEQKSSAERLFQEFEDVFSRNSSDIGHTTVTQHRIDTADHPPIKQHPRRLPFAKQEEVGTLLREMQENDIIEPSSSPWASPIVLVRKKDGSTRFCVDYRKLNDVTKKDSYPLPRIDDTLDTLSGHKWFSTLDLKSGYWQVEIHPEDREKQHSLPAKDYGSSKSCRGRTFEEHLQNIRKVLSKLSDANLKLIPSKCKFFQKEVNYLGHIISAEGVRTDPEKVSAVKNWKRPENLQALTSSPILIYPQPDKPFILDTDASNESVGAVLSQEIDGQERVVAYWSQVARWIQRLNEYYFDIRHRKGSSHGNADALQEDHAQKIVVIVPE